MTTQIAFRAFTLCVLMPLLSYSLTYGQEKSKTEDKSPANGIVQNTPSDPKDSINNPKKAGCKIESPCYCCKDLTCEPSGQDYELSKEYNVWFDFKNKHLYFQKGFSKIERTDQIRVQVYNYNPYLYQITIDGKDSSRPALMDSNNLLSSIMSLSNLSGVVAGIGQGALSKATEALPTGGGTGASLVGNTGGTGTKREKSSESKEEKAKRVAIEESCRKQFKIVSDEHLDKIQEVIDGFKDARDQLLEKQLAWDTVFAAQRHMYPTCNEFEIFNEQASKFTADINTLIENVSSGYQSIRNLQLDYSVRLDGCKDFINDKKNKDVFDLNQTILDFYKSAMTAMASLDSIVVIDQKILIAYRQAADRAKDITPCYTSNPIIVGSDARNVTISFKSWSDSLHLPSYSPISFLAPWTPRVIFGISGGIYGSGLHSDNYASTLKYTAADTTNHISADTSLFIKKQKNGAGEVGINALAYVAWKVRSDNPKNYLYCGATAGAGLSIESNPKPRMMIGATLVYGNTNRVMVTAGLAAGFVNRLSANLNEGLNKGTRSADVYSSKMSANAFISLSYSFIN